MKSGNAQTPRLPEEPSSLKQAFEILASMPDDFYPEKREDSLPQERG